MNYWLIIFIHCIYFALINFMPLAGAHLLAKRIASDSPVLKFALTIFFWFIQAAGIFSILGALGYLTVITGMISGLITGALFYQTAKKLFPPVEIGIQEKRFDRTVFLMQTATVCFVGSTIFKSTFILGTDPFLYHLYYPAMWLLRGEIHAISLIGLPHEYFPICGETLFGWLMLSGNDIFAPLLQPLAYAMSLCAVTALWRSYDIPERFIAGGVFLCAASGIIIENVCLCYTDALTGSFLVTGICFLILAHDGKIQEERKRYTLAIAAGLAMGISAAVKYSGLVLAPPVTLLLLIWFFIRRPDSRKFAWTTAGCAIFAAGAYYMPNFIKTGNPFYPVKIPFIFENGFDFERSTIPLKDMWSYFVNDNPWDMNIFNAVLFIALLMGGIFSACRKRSEEKRDLTTLMTVLMIIIVAAEILMLAIYPAMTQARQIIPFLMALGILFTPVLFLIFGKFLTGKKAHWFYTAAVVITGSVTVCNVAFERFAIFYTVIAVICIVTTLPGSVRIRRYISGGIAVIFFGVWYHNCFLRYDSALACIKMVGGQHVMEIVQHLRRDDVQKDCQRIASVGCWFNYMLMLDLPGNEVIYIPINEENTSHPHEVDTPADLRKNPVAYPVWRQRLQDAGCTFLIIDTRAHQDFPENREQELKWALDHPEDFTLICQHEHVSFFQINFR